MEKVEALLPLATLGFGVAQNRNKVSFEVEVLQYIENKDPVAPWGGVRVQAASCKTAAARAVLPINNLAFSAPTQKICHFMIPGI